ncbi:hypothetical protein Bbelb_138140 [Branchiostoma belcheri]|nr:hypothetical protein Bbelb_138140 [Branchiostoma belcheri]
MGGAASTQRKVKPASAPLDPSSPFGYRLDNARQVIQSSCKAIQADLGRGKAKPIQQQLDSLQALYYSHKSIQSQVCQEMAKAGLPKIMLDTAQTFLVITAGAENVKPNIKLLESLFSAAVRFCRGSADFSRHLTDCGMPALLVDLLEDPKIKEAKSRGARDMLEVLGHCVACLPANSEVRPLAAKVVDSYLNSHGQDSVERAAYLSAKLMGTEVRTPTPPAATITTPIKPPAKDAKVNDPKVNDPANGPKGTSTAPAPNGTAAPPGVAPKA